MTPHFSLAEFCRSDVATRRGIDNTLPAELLPRAQQTLEMLERIRQQLSQIAGRDVPVLISSGYRCPALNLAIGSSSTSDHPKGCAADINARAFGTPLKVAQTLAPMVTQLGIGQLILEFGSWVHVSTRHPDKAIDRIITISRVGVTTGIVEV